MINKRQKLFVIIFVIVILLISAGLRFYKLGSIQEQIFDEVYFPVFANNYLTQTDFFDAHPPLGKLIIASGIKLFGNTFFGWRVMDAVAGILLLVAVYGFTYSLTKRWQTALVALGIVAIEPMALVESRVGLINIYLALFSLLSLWFYWRWRESNYKKTSQFIVMLTFASAATAVKWIGIGALAVEILFFVIDWVRGRMPKEFNWLTLSWLILVPLVYLLTFIPDAMHGQDLLWWHKSAFNYHATLKETHPYGSTWWSWAIMQRPIWLYYKAPTPGMVTGIIEVGNIVIWISGLVALLYAILHWKKWSLEQRDRYLFLIVTYLALYLPWIYISRVKFIYHYFVPVLILLILLSVVLDEVVFSRKEWRWLGVTLLLVATAFFIYFLPLLIGYPITETFYRHHMWLKSWI